MLSVSRIPPGRPAQKTKTQPNNGKTTQRNLGSIAGRKEPKKLANLGVNTKVEVFHPHVPHVDYECPVNWTSGGVRDSKMYLCV